MKLFAVQALLATASAYTWYRFMPHSNPVTCRPGYSGQYMCASDDGVNCKWNQAGSGPQWGVVSGITASNPLAINCPGWGQDGPTDACIALGCWEYGDWYYNDRSNGVAVQCAGNNYFQCASNDGTNCRWGVHGTKSPYEKLTTISSSNPLRLPCGHLPDSNGNDPCLALGCYHADYYTLPDYSTGASAGRIPGHVVLYDTPWVFTATITRDGSYSAGSILSRHRSGCGGFGYLTQRNGKFNVRGQDTGFVLTLGQSYDVMLKREKGPTSYTKLYVDGALVFTYTSNYYDDGAQPSNCALDSADGGGHVPLMVGAHYWNNDYYHGSHATHFMVDAFTGTITNIHLQVGIGETDTPTTAPTLDPTANPTDAPTVVPTDAPTVVPTDAPTVVPTDAPTSTPTAAPTQFSADVELRVLLTLPTDAPTADPTAAPTNAPTGAPTVVPTDAPTVVPTDAPTAAPTAAPTYAVGLNAGDVLGPGDRIVSPNGLHALVMQSDGNLVLYKDGTVVWATSLYGVSLSAGSSAALQGDGNFVLYAPGMQALWAFHSTSPNAGVGSSPAGTYIRLQDDGNLVAYGPDGATVWHTKTYDMQPSYEWDFRGCTGDVDSHGIVAMLKDGASCSSEGLVLDGTSGYVHVEPYLFGGLISIETKFRFDSLSGRSWMRIFDWGSGSHQNNIYFAQHYNTNNLVVQYHETASTGQQWGAIVDGFTITPGEWITARLAAGPEGIKVYINGVKIVDAAGDYSSPYVTRTQQYIGKSNWPDSLFVGTIAYMKVWHGTVDFEEQIYTWDFRNCAGDVWSHGLTARLQNGATCNADGVEFDGVDDFVDVDDFSFGDGISIEVKYVYHSTSSWMRIFDFGSGQHANNLYFGQHAGSQNTILTYHEKVHDGVTAGHQMSEVMSGGLEGWNTVRMSIGRNGLKIWRNDVQVVDKSGDYSLPTATRTNQYIGKSNWPDPSFHGKIAYMKIWKNSDNFGGPVSRRRRNLLALAEGAQRHLLSVPADSDVLPALADSLKVDAADISITSITEVNTGLYEVLFAVTVRADTAEELETMRTQVRETVYSEDFEVAGFYSVLSTEAPTAAPTPEPTDMPTFNFVAPEAASLSSGYVLSDDEHAMAGSPGQGHLFVLAIDADHTLYRCPKDQNMKFCYACADPSRNAFAKTNRPASITQWFEQDGFTGEAHDGTWSVDADSVLHWVGADQTDYSFQITTKEIRRL